MRFTNLIGTGAHTVNAFNKNLINLFGNVIKKQISGVDCYGSGLTRFMDVQTDFGGLVALSGVSQKTPNGRKFIVSSVVAGVASVALYSVNSQNEDTPLGRILVTLPNQGGTTTHTPRFIRVFDTGTTNWTIIIGSVAATTTVNGGHFRVHKVNLSDFSFSPSPTQFFMQIASDSKGVYMMQDPTAIGVNHLMRDIIGGGVDGTELITARGTAAALSHDAFDMTQIPTMTSHVCTAATSIGSPIFTMTAHPFSINDPVVPTSGTPGGFTQANGASTQVVYYVSATGFGANNFQLSLTPGGAVINATSVATTTFVRAFGTTTVEYKPSRKMSVAATGFVGAAILIDACKIITPADGPNVGVKCFFLPTASNFYHWPLTSIASGNTSLAGAAGVNNLGTGTDYTAISTVLATYSDTLGKIIYTTAAFGFLMKGWVNSQISHSFGTQINTWLENQNHEADYFRGFVTSGIEVENGQIYVAITTVGQRGYLVIDARSDKSFGYSKLITPITDIGGVAKGKFIATLEKLYEITDTISIRYKSAALETDTIFDNPNTGWTSIEIANDLSAINFQRFNSFEIQWDVLTVLSGIPTQVSELMLGFDLYKESAPQFVGMADGTTSVSPSHAVYRQIKLVGGTPELIHRGIDDNENVVETISSTVNPSQVTHSLDEGLTWLPGAGPDQVFKRLRFTRVSPPGVIVTNSVRFD